MRIPYAAEAAALHTLWAYQLDREYQNLLYQFSLPVRGAMVRVEPMEGKWGSWDASARTVRISVALIENYPWDVVVEILKHEVAHQLVSEHFAVREAHGPVFAQACRMVGVLPWAASPSGELPAHLPSWRDRALAPAEEKLLKKVQKLLALATSSNEHEAFLAMQRVREIYARYNLDALTAQAEDDVVHLLISRKRKRTDAVETHIFSILVEHFFVRAIHCSQYDAHDLCSYRAVEIIGRRESVLMAEYVYHFLHQQLDALWCGHAGTTSGGAVAKKSYQTGVLSGFSQKLRANVVTPAGRDVQKPGALMRRDQPVLADYVRCRHPRLQTRGPSTGRHDPAAFASGKAAGARLTLHRAVGDTPTERGRLLRG